MDKNIERLNKLGISFYKAEESESCKYIMIPKQFYICPFYKKYLTPVVRELYAWLVDRMSLSKKTTAEGNTNYIDENGYIYLVFSRADVMNKLNISKQTCSDSFKILNKLGLIYEKRLGQGYANRIYIGKVKYMSEEEALKMIELVETEGLFQKSKNQTSKNTICQKSKNQTSKSLKNRLLEVENLDAINTEYTNTEYITSSSNNDQLIKYFEENICKLRKTTLCKFIDLINNNKKDFLIAVIEECILTNVASFKGFSQAVDNYIKANCKTANDVHKYAIEFNINKKKKYNNYTKKSNTKENKFVNYEGQREYDYDSLERKLLGWDKPNDDTLTNKEESDMVNDIANDILSAIR